MTSSTTGPSWGSHGMTLRSRCDGSCGSSSLEASPNSSYSGRRRASLLQSPDTPPRRHHHHHFHSHHHHHHHNGHSQGIVEELRAKETLPAPNSPQVAVRLTRFRPAALELSRGRKSTASAVNRLTSFTRSIFTEETVVRSSRKKVSSHSDYSSADEELTVELNGARTTSPKQSNGGVVGSSSQLTANLVMSDSSDDVILSDDQRSARFATAFHAGNQSARTSAYNERWTSTARNERVRNGLTSFRGQWPSPVESRASLVHLYGLDDDLDDEEIDVMKMDASGQHQYRDHQQQQSWFRRKDIEHVLRHFKSVWWTFWYFVYWVIGTAALLDTAFVIRCRKLINGSHNARKYIIPLLLMLLLLGGSSFWAIDQSGSQSSVIQNIANVPYHSLSYLYGFLNFSSTAAEKTEALGKTEHPADWAWLSRTNFTSVLHQMILQIYGHPDDGRLPLDMARLDALVQDAVQKRMTELGYTKLHASHGSDNGRAALEAEFAKLKAQVEASEQNSGKFQSDYQSIKAQMNQYHQSVHLNTQESNQRILKLEHQLLELQEKLLLQDHRHNLLLANMRNCCRNHSEYAAFVKDHVVIALNDLSGAPGTETCERLAPFQTWLKSYFTTKDDLHQHVSFITEAAKNKESDDERVARLLQANKAMIAAIVAEQLRAHAAAEAPKATISLDGSVTEDQFKALIHQQIALYNADRLGLPDFALESSGGSVVSTRCSESYHLKTAQYSILGIGLWYVSSSPRTVIQPGVSPGECWAFKGAQGYIVIKLSRRIQITGLSLEHIPKSISPSGSIDTAPKEFQVWGLDDENVPGVELGKYVYDQDGEPLQYFVVKDLAEPPIFQMVELRILSNHGNPEYTCLYRFRVHGDLVRH